MKRSIKKHPELANLYEFRNMRDGAVSTIRIALVNPNGNEELFVHYSCLEDAKEWLNDYLGGCVYKDFGYSARIVA